MLVAPEVHAEGGRLRRRAREADAVRDGDALERRQVVGVVRRRVERAVAHFRGQDRAVDELRCGLEEVRGRGAEVAVQRLALPR